MHSPEGVLRVYVELSVDVREMRDWPPSCIREFFNGITRAREAVLTARAMRQTSRPAPETPA